VALDAVAVYVHADNDVESLSLEELEGIFRGRIDDWSELGQRPGPIVLYSRENNSGTYAYFKEHVLGGRDFASSAQTLPGTAAVINAVSRDRRGIGYGGIGYAGGVRTVPLREGEGEPVAPTAENAIDGAYPLARFLYMYTAGEPGGVAADFIEWVRSDEGQRLVSDIGYYPLPSERTREGNS
jgi:phosphate transport system substrate-binding protein